MKPCLSILVAFVASAAVVAPAVAQTAPPADPQFRILDNSFLIEEAFNQETRVFQNIFGFARSNTDGTWDLTFTQEWPVGGPANQFSYTLDVNGTGTSNGFGDVLINYRHQVMTEDARHPAFAPRVSLIVPTGNNDRGHGAGAFGWQASLPFSKRFGDFYVHANAGFTHLLGVTTPPPPVPAAMPDVAASNRVALFSPFAGASLIWRTREMFHLMLEGLVRRDEAVTGWRATEYQTGVTVAPGFRTGWNLGDKQVVVGAAVPITRDASGTTAAAFLYFSYELPFGK